MLKDHMKLIDILIESMADGGAFKAFVDSAIAKQEVQANEGLNIPKRKKHLDPEMEKQLSDFIKKQIQEDKSEYKGGAWNDKSWLATEIAQYINGSFGSSYTSIWASNKKLNGRRHEILGSLKRLYPDSYKRALELIDDTPKLSEGLNLVRMYPIYDPGIGFIGKVDKNTLDQMINNNDVVKEFSENRYYVNGSLHLHQLDKKYKINK